jgi:DNA repair protein RecN (Recombination protein N)
MLRALTVRNLAVVERADVDFAPGLNLVTGETGAGKSLLVDAIALLLGTRADLDVIRQGAEAARVEGVFDLSPALSELLAGMGLGAEDGELVVRREIRRERSRAFLNDSPVSVESLRRIGTYLGEVHGQGAHQSLLQDTVQRRLLDEWTGLGRRVGEVGGLHGSLREAEERLARLRADEGERERRLDTLEFQIAELEGASLRPGEMDALQVERDLLRNAERLRELSGGALELLSEGEGAAIERVGQALRSLEEAAGLCGASPLVAAVKELQPALAHLQDAGAEVASWTSGLESDPSHLEEVEERLASLERIVRKYGGSEEEAAAFLESARRERDALLEEGTSAEGLAEEVETRKSAYAEAAALLSEQRRGGARRLAKRVEEELRALDISRARFEIGVEAVGGPGSGIRVEGREVAPGPEGVDRVEFQISTNVGMEPRPLNRIASGGELARVMLALRCVGAQGDEPRTLVFDEVDAGVGGRAAESLASRLRGLAAHHQVLCVTHLPQVAARGDLHLAVRKRASRGRTLVQVARVEGEKRVEEVARMLGGEPAALRHARELVREELP